MTLEQKLERARKELKDAEWRVSYHTIQLEDNQFSAELWRKNVAMLEAEISTLAVLNSPEYLHDLPEMRRELRESADIPVAPLEG